MRLVLVVFLLLGIPLLSFQKMTLDVLQNYTTGWVHRIGVLLWIYRHTIQNITLAAICSTPLSKLTNIATPKTWILQLSIECLGPRSSPFHLVFCCLGLDLVRPFSIGQTCN